MSLDFDERDQQSVIRDLESDDQEVRRLAVERVGSLSLPEAIERLVEHLGDSSWRVRKAAVERLVAISDDGQTADAMIRALGDGDNPGRRNSAVEALVACGSRVVPRLIEATNVADADVRKLVVDALAGVADPRATQPLIDLLEDPDPNVRAASADALGAIAGDAAIQALQNVATRQVEDQLVRFSALHALAAVDAPISARDLGPVLEDPILRPAGLGLLGRRDDDEDVAVLIKGFISESRPCREASIRSFLRLLALVDDARSDDLVTQIREAAISNPDVVRSAAERLEDAALPIRLALVQFLGLLNAEEAVVPILRAGRDEALAQVALGTLEALGAVSEHAIDAAWSDLDTVARRDACMLFGRTRGERGGERLLTALGDENSEIRVAAMRSIGERRLAAALPLLVNRLDIAASHEDPDDDELPIVTQALIDLLRSAPGDDAATTDHAIELLSGRLHGAADGVRLAIARVLGCIGRRKDTELVTFLLKDPSALVRRAAVDALARLDPGTDGEPLRLALADESPTVRIAAAGALGSSKSTAVLDDLKRLAEDEDPRVRAAAVRSIGVRFGRSEDPELRMSAMERLTGAFGDDFLVALAALEALREIGGPEVGAAAALLERSESELVREAIGCIASHDVAAMDALLPLVSHSDWSVRAEAIQALSDRRVARAVPSILRRLETEQDEFVRDVILRALKRLES